MSYRGPKVKLSRALGIPLTRKSSIVMTKKPNPPGQHGNGRKRKKSNYGEQLLEKQRLRFQYNVSEKQLRNYYKKAIASKGNSGTSLLQLLESRLDNIVYRAGFAPTIYAARQLVNHGHVMVDGRKVDIPSYLVKPGQLVHMKEKSKTIPVVQQSIDASETPIYIEKNAQEFSTRLIRPPEAEEIPIICNTQMVVEFYSR